ncbi:hypothetical protein AB0I10_33185 [Streptomyces sp. NPDC050636]|uniref:hypothetical protein n=1 Tax=Streptomyces sp. NPDC050636 TaxID=3154510 RepID=UPI0034143244
MRTVLDGEVHVHYGQIYVESGEDDCDLHESFAGQANGLCGGAVPGGLFLITGLHTGSVGFTVEVHDHAPPLDEAWEEIVEVSFTPASAETLLVEWGGGDCWPLHLEQTGYRVRYSGHGMDEARELDTRLDPEPQRDRYLLQFWPAPPVADRVIKQTSQNAAYWHGVARELPPPPSPEERAEAKRRARKAEEAEAERLRLEWEAEDWGGRLPCERLRQVGGNVLGMVELDRDLVDAIVATPSDTQRAIARWAARRAYTLAGLCDIDWIAAALSAAERGQPLPAPFVDFETVWDALWSEKRVPDTTVRSLDGAIPNMSQQAMALPALFDAVESDPLQAALDALYSAAATFGPDHPALFAEVRQAWPAVADAPPH